MCCETCIRYEKCLEDDELKDDCCLRCPEYSQCSGTERNYRDDGRNAYGYGNEEDY